MSEIFIYKEENEKLFWEHWDHYTKQFKAGPSYARSNIEWVLSVSKSRSLFLSDKSFIFLVNNKPEAIVFLPVESENCINTITVSKGYVFAPLFNSQSLAKKVFSKISEICLENNIKKIMFSVDPLEGSKIGYNYLQKFGYLDSSILEYSVDLKVSDLLQDCRKGHKCDIKKMLKDENVNTFILDYSNANYELHEDYRKLHHKCSGKVTRSKETFDAQYEILKHGQAILVGIKYKENNIGFAYFNFFGDVAIYASGADNPDYGHLPIYHLMVYKAMEFFKKKGLKYIFMGQPVSPSVQYDYYPDEKQLNIGTFKRGFGGGFINNYRGIKYLSFDLFELDTNNFIENYKKTM